MAQPRKLHDRFFKLAKAEGYLARSAYKLKQIQERRALLRSADWVLDLGCAPGSWLQVASQLVGSRGRVVGLDLKAVTHPMPPNVRAVVGDAVATPPAELLARVRPDGPDSTARPDRRFDVLLSDMAPDTTGYGDDLLSARLCDRVLDLAPALLRPGGRLVMKIFEGERYPELLRRAASMFVDARGYKPEASRDVSREMYIIAEGLRADVAADGPAPDQPPRARAGGPPPPGRGWS
ncbi:MAG: RlmE family RNA methyltransferase [Phycisphaerae bacterium]|nr:RlmE family RNA methyltransferase [Phycisphaerae bacterium]